MYCNVNPFGMAQRHVDMLEQENNFAKLEEHLTKSTTVCFDVLTSLQIDASLIELECDFIERSLQEDLQDTVIHIERYRVAYLQGWHDRQDQIRHALSYAAQKWHPKEKGLEIKKEPKCDWVAMLCNKGKPSCKVEVIPSVEKQIFSEEQSVFEEEDVLQIQRNPFQQVLARVEQSRKKQLEKKVDQVICSLLEVLGEVRARGEALQERLSALQKAIEEEGIIEAEIFPQVLIGRDEALQSIETSYQKLLKMMRDGQAADPPIELTAPPASSSIAYRKLEIVLPQKRKIQYSLPSIAEKELSQRILKYLQILQAEIQVEIHANSISHISLRIAKNLYRQECEARCLHFQQLWRGIYEDYDRLYDNWNYFYKQAVVYHWLCPATLKQREEMLQQASKTIIEGIFSSEEVCKYGFLSYSWTAPAPHALYRGKK